jgi:hypothetical protein
LKIATGSEPQPAQPAASAPSAWTQATKLAVRRRAPTLIAIRSTHAHTVDLVDGRSVGVQAGDWLITRGQAIVDWARGHTIDERYDIVIDGQLSVPPAICLQIERMAGIGTTKTPASLVAAIERLARIRIGTVDVAFTPGQLEEIAQRATKRGRTVTAELQAVVERIKGELFWRG